MSIWPLRLLKRRKSCFTENQLSYFIHLTTIFLLVVGSCVRLHLVALPNASCSLTLSTTIAAITFVSHVFFVYLVSSGSHIIIQNWSKKFHLSSPTNIPVPPKHPFPEIQLTSHLIAVSLLLTLPYHITLAL